MGWIFLAIIVAVRKYDCFTFIPKLSPNKDIKVGLFKKEVRDLIAFWKMEIQEIGYEEYIKSSLAKSFHDHLLIGDRQDERSINLNESGGRLIYKYHKRKILVKVIKITAIHDYSKRRSYGIY